MGRLRKPKKVRTSTKAREKRQIENIVKKKEERGVVYLISDTKINRLCDWIPA